MKTAFDHTKNFCRPLLVSGLLGLALGLAACSSKVNFGVPDATNNFGQSIAYNNKVDIVWIADNSLSMLKHQRSLSTQIPAMVQKLNDLKLDYHMGVITTSMGAGGNGGRLLGSPAFLTNATPNVASVLADRLVVGEDGSNLERGIDSLLSLITPTNLNGAAKNFIRGDALLVVIALSDEDDQSARTQLEVTTALDQLKPRWSDGTRGWMVNFIGVLALSSQCTTFNNIAYVGLFYMGLADVSNGTKDSICTTDFAQSVTNIRTRIIQVLTDYKLNKTPIVSTIVVSVNGQPVAQDAVDGWTYELTGNLVRFHGRSVPAADSAIKVDFTPAFAN